MARRTNIIESAGGARLLERSWNMLGWDADPDALPGGCLGMISVGFEQFAWTWESEQK